MHAPEALLAALVDLLPAAVYVCDPEGRILQFNRRAVELWGRTPSAEDRFCGSLRMLQADGEVVPHERCPMALALASGDSFQDRDITIERPDGSHIVARVNIAPLRDDRGRVIGAVNLFEDITERRNIAEARRERDARLQLSLQQLEDDNRLKDEFLAMLSHELRTPLNAIMGWSQILASPAVDDTVKARAVETIQRNARLQAQMIGDLLDVSRIITGKLALNEEEIDLATVVTAAVDDVKPAAASRSVALQLSVGSRHAIVTGDAARLQQIVWNLLSNAVKFTPDGGRVGVTLDVVDGQAEIAVRDTGQGIPPEFLDRVFDRFRQAESTTTRTHGGLGLGLGIVKHLTHLHGGTVRAASDGAGHGSTFTVRLPLRATRSAAAGLEAPRPEAPSLDGLRVLVVDDHKDSADLLTWTLTRAGAAVQTVYSARETLEAISRQRFDTLVADIGMPGMDGYELMRTVRAERARRAGARLVAVAVTAYASLSERDRALAAGFDWHLPKPVEADRLVEFLATACRAV